MAKTLSQYVFLKMPRWLIREWTLSLFPYDQLSQFTPPSLYFSLLRPSFIGCEASLSFRCLIVIGDVHASHVEGAEPLTTQSPKSWQETIVGAAARGRRKSRLHPWFLAISGTVRPPFMMRSSVLEWALSPPQNHAPLDRRIFAIQKPVTIHIVTSTAFSSEPGKFHEVRPPKV